jgi:hypothetical protein
LQICGHCRARPKSNAVLVPVRRALKIILQQNKPLGHASPINVCFLHKSRHPRRNYLFSTTMGARPVSGFSKTKQRLDKEMLTELGNLEPWVIHDIRRTMRTGLPKQIFAEQPVRKNNHNSLIWLAVPRGVEPPTFGLGNRCSILLSYGTVRRDLAQLSPPRTGSA